MTLCVGRFTITLIEDIVNRFAVVSTDGTELVPRWNAAPTQEIAAIFESRNSRGTAPDAVGLLARLDKAASKHRRRL
jgi:hypothetical protein